MKAVNRLLTADQLSAVVYAVETLCMFNICDSAGAIKQLCALDPRVRGNVKDRYGAMAYIFPENQL